MEEERAKRLTGVGSRSERSVLWRGIQGPLAEVQGAAPPEAFGFYSTCKRPRKALLEIFFSLNQTRSGTEMFHLNDTALCVE